ncbi:MAG: FlaD/FlaE family flagellar protein [Candidatus Nanopusillus acidilobi]
MSIFSDIFRKKNDNKNAQNINVIPQQNIVSQNYTSEIKNITNSIEGLAKSVRELENKVSEISSNISNISSTVESHQNEINSIKNNLEKVFSIYEMLIKSYNPFVEEEKKEESNVQVINENNIENQENNILPLSKLDDNPTVSSIIIGWLAYLVKKSNVEEVDDALDYYESINWITEKVKIKLKEYLNGLKSIEGENKKLLPMDHIVSLYIISKLAQISSSDNIERLKDLYNELIQKGYISPITR